MKDAIQEQFEIVHQMLADLRDGFKSKAEQLKSVNLKNSMDDDNRQDFVQSLRLFFKQTKKALTQVWDQLQIIKDIYSSQKSQIPIDLKKLVKAFRQKKQSFQKQVDTIRKIINAKKEKLQEMKKVSNLAQQVFEKEGSNYVRMTNNVGKIIQLIKKQQLGPNTQAQQSKAQSINISKISKKSSLNNSISKNRQELSILSNQSISPDIYCQKKHKLVKMVDAKRQTFGCDICQKDYQIKFSGNQCKPCKYTICMFCSAKLYKALGKNLHLQKDNSVDSSMISNNSRILQQLQKDQIRFTRSKLQGQELSTLKKYKKQSKVVQSQIKYQKKQSIKGNLRQVSSVLSSKYKQKVQDQKEQVRKRCPNCKKFMKKTLKICQRCQDEDY